MRRRRRTAHGFTIYEVVVVIVLSALALSTLGQLLGSNSNLVQDTRAQQRSEAEHRRNLGALCEVFRTADLATLDGFAANGVSSNPHFERVTGATMEDRTTGGPEELLWIASSEPVPGVARPGAVYLVRGGVQQLVADRIPQGGFYCKQQGQSVLIHLTTYYLTNARRLVLTTSDALVSLRN